MACMLCACSALFSCKHTPPGEPHSTPAEPVTLYLTHLDADLSLHTDEDHVRVDAEVTLRGALSRGGGTLILDAVDFRDLHITARPALARQHIEGDQITLVWGETSQPDYTVTMTYSATPEKGVVRAEQDIWTSFHTWHWLPTHSSPGRRATLALEVSVAEPGWQTTTTQFARDTPHPAYTYGFHATRRDPIDTLARSHGEHELVVKGTPHGELVMARTEGALTRWKSVFGENWAPARYTQVFVPGRAMQEAAGLSFLSDSHATGLLTTPEEDWLIVHELAHQEWGNLVTCATWGDFWINEAFAVWWVYRDKALRGDEQGARREVELWRARTRRALERGDDPRIHRPGAAHQNAGGSIVYNAGALVLHAIFTHLGEAAFERTLRDIVASARARGGLSMSTSDFLDAFELDDAFRQAIEARLGDARLVLE